MLTADRKMTLSVAIICSNNEDTLGMVLASVQPIADEIVVIVDENSKDKTYEIAKKHTERVTIEPWRGFVAQKNEALKKCTSDWVLSLDSDEVLTETLGREILEVIKKPNIHGYFLRRRTIYAGQTLHHSWQPDERLRLVLRSAGPEWAGGSVHETLQFKKLEPTIATKHLIGFVDHYSYKDMTDHFRRTLQYAKGIADDRYLKGKRFSMFKTLFAPPIAFTKQFFIKKGFLDGKKGLVVAFSSAFYSLMKQLFLLENSWKSITNINKESKVYNEKK